MAVLGLDIGTTRTKCQVFGEVGSVLSEASGEFPLLRRGGESYLDIRALTQKVFQVIGQAAKASPQPPGPSASPRWANPSSRWTKTGRWRTSCSTPIPGAKRKPSR